jgi:hemerythrin-like domain-containing protein
LDIIDEITEDHRHIRQKMELLVLEGIDSTEKDAAFTDLSSLIGAHTEAEEKTVYACAKKMGALRHFATLSEQEHSSIDEMLEQIKDAKGSAIRQARSLVLSKLLKHHLEMEEEHFLPALRRELTVIDRDRLARKYRRVMPAPELELVDEEKTAEIYTLPARRGAPAFSPATLN